MARTTKTNKVKNKAAVTKKKTSKKKTVKKKTVSKTTNSPLKFPSNKDKGKTLGYFELSVGEGRIIDIALQNFLFEIKKIKLSGDDVKIREWTIDRTESLIKIFQNALKESYII